MGKEKAKIKIKKLIDKYESLSETEEKGLNESQVKDRFIRPLFETLGWDFEDDVWSEFSVSKKRGDYAFKIDGVTKFFIEAKPLSTNIDEIKWAEQVIWYAWHKSVPWAILTNFKAIKVYNAEWDEQDPERSLVLEIKYQDYLRDERLWWLSKEEIEKGTLDKHAEENFKKPKRAPVDKQLIADLLRWREKLFKDFRGYNSLVSGKKISENIQRVLNRLIFIRTCEDREFENRVLQEAARNWKEKGSKNNELVNNLRKIFIDFDGDYDSKLFEEKIIFDKKEFIVDDNTLFDVIEETYKSSKGIRWNFNDIREDVLGSIYEQYLGFVQKNEKEDEETDKSKRKSHGIYYTPQYIVDYIIKNTLLHDIKEKSFEEVRKIKILDPACGSGSFLIRTYKELIDYQQIKKRGKNFFEKGTHLGQIEKTIKQKEGNKLLSSQEKMNILRNNIYGVDLDEKAVEIAQLNLLLKTVDRKMKLLNLQHVLCGNSLISGGEADLKKHFGKNWREKKPFKWEEKFPEVFQDGGFDIIIGNPPYVNMANIKDAKERDYLKEAFETSKNKSDLYSFFCEKAVNLLKNGGLLGFIFSNSWLGTDSFSKFREFLIENTKIYELVRLPPGVFEDATVTTVLIFLKKEKADSRHEITLREYSNGNFVDLPNKLSYQRILDSPNFSFSFNPEIKFRVPVDELGKVAKLSLGIKTSEDAKFILSQKKDNDCYPLLRGRNVDRYSYKHDGKWIWYRPDLMMQKVGAGPRKLENFLRDKILFRSISGGKILAAFDLKKFLSNDKVHILYETKELSMKFLIAVLNSKLIDFWIKSTFNNLLEIKINQLERILIPKIDLNKKKDKTKHDVLVNLADKMIKLNEKLQKLHPIMNDDEYDDVKSEILKTDRLIDYRVYELYGLTKKEIGSIEKND